MKDLRIGILQANSLQGKPCVFQVLPVGKVTASVRFEHEYVRRDSVDDLLQLHFALPESRFRLLGVFDVMARSVPLNDVSLFIAQRYLANAKPSIFPISTPNPCLILEGLACGQSCTPLLHKPFNIVRMNDIAPSPAPQFFRLESGVFQPPQVDEIDRAVRTSAEDERRDGVDDAPETVFDRIRWGNEIMSSRHRHNNDPGCAVVAFDSCAIVRWRLRGASRLANVATRSAMPRSIARPACSATASEGRTPKPRTTKSAPNTVPPVKVNVRPSMRFTPHPRKPKPGRLRRRIDTPATRVDVQRHRPLRRATPRHLR